MNIFKIILLKLIYIIRAWLGWLVFLFSLILSNNFSNSDEEESIKYEIESKEIEMESKSKFIDNKELPISQQPIFETITKTEIKTNFEEIETSSEETQIYSEGKSEEKNKNKKDASEIMNNTNNAITSFVGSLGVGLTVKASTAKTKMMVGAGTVIVTGVTAAYLTVIKQRIIENYDKYVNLNDIFPLPFPRHGSFNLIDTNSINDYLFSLINKISTLDTDSQLIIYSIIILICSIFYLTYIFIFMVSPSILNAIKDILPIRIKNFIIKSYKINRVLNVPFIILNFIMVVVLILLVIFLLTVLVYFK